MHRFSIYFLFLLLFSTWACHHGKPVTTQKGKGFYQYINDDTTRRNLSPFYSDKEGKLARNGMVSSAHPAASQVGVEILKAGGSAIDAAIAVQFALAVVHPAAGNIGGGGFVVYRDKTGKAYTLDFREKAPARATRNMYLDSSGSVVPDLSFTGHLASGVPGTVAGMVEAHRRFGRLPWETLLEPAVRLADKGVVLTSKEAKGLNYIKDDLERLNPGKKYLLRSDEWKSGDTLIQADLARTLRQIRDKKREGFYAGETARLIAEEMQRGGGMITPQDLASYQAVWREPITAAYKNYRIISMPPPSSGGVALVQLLKMVEPYPLTRWGWNNDSTVMVMIEAERRVYADRAKFLGDPDFVKIPVQQMISADYLQQRMRDFSFAKASDSRLISAGKIAGYESSETTHFSIVDQEGNAVAITTTLNGSYGSRVFVKGAGFLLNNEMDDFSAKPGVPNAYGLIGAEANAIQPGKRMLSSMTPTIIEKDGKLLMVVGTPGGSTIITAVFQTILNVLEHGMTMQQAVNALKFHHQWMPDKTTFEQHAFSPATIRFLQNRGQNLEELKGTIGRMDAILIREDGQLEGGSDPRGDDTAAGY